MSVPRSPVQFLRRAEREYADQTAVVCVGKRYTYSQFGVRVSRLAGALRSSGVQTGDRIAFLGSNCHRLLEARYGVPEAGAALLPLNICLTPDELVEILNNADATVLFLDPAFAHLVDFFNERVPTLRKVVALDSVEQASCDSYEDLLASAQPYRADEVDENAAAEIYYTGESSSDRFVLTHRDVHARALEAPPIAAKDALLHTIPLSYEGWSGAAHQITMSGGKHVMLGSFDAAEVFRLIARERVNGCFLAPAMALELLQSPERLECELRSLKWLAIDGPASFATLTDEIKRKLRCDCFYRDRLGVKGTVAGQADALWQTARA